MSGYDHNCLYDKKSGLRKDRIKPVIYLSQNQEFI